MIYERVEQVMQDEEIYNVRLTVGDKWMVWEEATNSWVVYQKKYRQRGVTELRFKSLSDALKDLIRE